MPQSTLRSERARRRAAQQRNARILIIAIAVVVLALIAFFAYQSFAKKSTTSAISTPYTGETSMTTTASGLKYRDLVVGTGPAAQPGDVVRVNYTGWLEDGTKFDSSYDRGQPFQFGLGQGQVIKGWDEGVVGMQVGGKRRLVIPPDLGYGPQGAGNLIPPNSILIFEVELLAIAN